MAGCRDELDGNIVGSGVRAGFIKLSAGDDGLTEAETKILRAGTRAAVATGATIGSHTIRGGVVRDQLDIIEGLGGAPGRFIWIHTQAEPDFDLHLEMAAARLLDRIRQHRLGPGGRRGAYRAHPADAGSGLRRSTAVEPRHGMV